MLDPTRHPVVDPTRHPTFILNPILQGVERHTQERSDQLCLVDVGRGQAWTWQDLLERARCLAYRLAEPKGPTLSARPDLAVPLPQATPKVLRVGGLCKNDADLVGPLESPPEAQAQSLLEPARDACDPPPGALVGLHLERSADFVAGMLACWWAGRAWTVVDPGWPAERQQRWKAICQVQTLVTREPDTPADEAPCPGATHCTHCAGHSSGLKPKNTLQTSWHPDTLAYVLATSGSSGQPRGVCVAHRGLRPLLEAQVAAFELDTESKVLWMLSPAFDASVSDVGCALYAGATLYIDPRPLPEALAAHAISHVDLPPSLLGLYRPEAMPASVRSVVVGGEPSPPEVLRRWARTRRVVCVYGPTEATVCSSLRVCDPITWDRPWLGQPLAGTWFVVLDRHLQPVGPGEVGELCIGGEGLALGYLRDPAHTHARFVVWLGKRIYRTGDAVRFHPAGSEIGAEGPADYCFVGRLDRQVQFRGQRLEPEEIEHALLGHPHVARAYVLVVTQDTQPRLVACLETGAATQALDPHQVRTWLTHRLPPWMVPQEVRVFAALPLTSSGKIDGPALQRLLAAGENASAEEGKPEATPPRGEGKESLLPPAPRRLAPRPLACDSALDTQGGKLSSQVTRWFAHALNLKPEEIGAHQSLGELGADSLGVLRLLALAQAAGHALSPALMGTDLTPHQLTSLLETPTQTGGFVAATNERGLVGSWLRQHAWVWPGAPAPPENREGSRARPEDPPQQILLTGGTGYFGARLLAELLKASEATLHCVVRAPSTQQGRHRLAEALALHQLDPHQAWNPRVRVLCGRLEQPDLGLDPRAYQHLLADIDTIVHAAARVHVHASFADLFADNVLATRHVARLAWPAHGTPPGARPKRMHLISTLSVYVAASPCAPVLHEGQPLCDEVQVVGGYAQSKWVAEAMLEGLPGPVWVYRLGLITGNGIPGRGRPEPGPHGSGHPRDMLLRFARGLQVLGCVPRPHPRIHVDVTPVDHAAARVVALMLGAPPERYHVANPHSLSWTALLRSLRRAGLALPDVAVGAFRERVAAVTANPQLDPELRDAAAFASLALCRSQEGDFAALRTLDLFASTQVSFDMQASQTALGEAFLPCPRADAGFLARLWSGLTEPASLSGRTTPQ